MRCLNLAMLFFTLSCASVTFAKGLNDRCQALMNQIGVNNFVRLKNDRIYMGQAISQMVETHFDDYRNKQGPLQLTPHLQQYLKKYLELQRDLFNEWHKDTGLVATVEWDTASLRNNQNGEAQDLQFPMLRFRYDQNNAITKPATFFGHNLINSFKNDNRIKISYNPVQRLIDAPRADAYLKTTKNPGINFHIFLSENDFFGLDTLSKNFLHEKAHLSVEQHQHPSSVIKTSQSPLSTVTGHIKANHPSTFFSSNYLNDTHNKTQSMSLDEIYAYWISVKSSEFNFKQIQKRSEIHPKEVEKAKGDLEQSQQQLRDTSNDALTIFKVIQDKLKNPNSPLNIKTNTKGEMSLILNLSKKDFESAWQKKMDAPEDYVMNIELPLELEPPKRWALAFEQFMQARSSSSGIQPLPPHLRTEFLKDTDKRIQYVLNRLRLSNKTSKP